jgi:asparagine synthase (glutamine-hydrolysing)
MCGIYGYFDRQRQSLAADKIDSMAIAIQHRGPDGHGKWTADGVALGNQRLAILDPEGGEQPFISADGSIIVVQNGEIFNFVELAKQLRDLGVQCQTHCDTEVILRLYETYGIDFVPMLNGMFAIAIFDTRKDCLYLIRDRVGEKPLYIHDNGKRILFGSEIKSILAAGVAPSLDEAALDEYLTLNFIPPPRTIYRGIEHVLPGHWMEFRRDGSVIKRQWWRLADMHAEERSEAEWIDLFHETLADAVRLRLRSDVPFGAFLSGGVDSSTVVGMMAGMLNHPVKTFCIGFHEPRFDESQFAAQAATRFNTDHVMERVDSNLINRWPRSIWHCDQPHGDISFIPTLRVSELAAQHVKMVLTGDGADELFAGYDKFKGFFNNPASLTCSEAEFRRLYYQQISLFGDSERRQLRVADTAKAGGPIGTPAWETINEHLDHVAHMDRINQALYLDMMLLLPGNNLVKPDRMSMAVGLETRAPFLDYRMMELAFRMPGHLKLHNGETKYLYKKAVRSLIGDDLAYRNKQMFTVPVGEWLKSGLIDFSHDMLTSSRASQRGYFNAQYVQNMLMTHRKGVKDFTRELRALIAVELWNREFIDQRVNARECLAAA